eukprot:11454193-Prorocentrum_lima.AAC.1
MCTRSKSRTSSISVRKIGLETNAFRKAIWALQVWMVDASKRQGDKPSWRERETKWSTYNSSKSNSC